jgi:hypothetical protein
MVNMTQWYLSTSPQATSRTHFCQNFITDATMAPAQVAANGANGHSSIQTTPEEGMKNVSLLIPIPWDVGNDPDHHKVRSRGAAPMVGFNGSTRQNGLLI